MIFETLMESADRGELILWPGGLLHYHLRRDGQLTIREIIVLPGERCKGIGRLMLQAMKSHHPEALSVFAKCPADLPSNGWYARMGFVMEGTETTKSGRRLNRWRLLPQKCNYCGNLVQDLFFEDDIDGACDECMEDWQDVAWEEGC